MDLIITCGIDDSIVEGITKVNWYVSIEEIFVSDIIFKVLAYSLSIIKFISAASETYLIGILYFPVKSTGKVF